VIAERSQAEVIDVAGPDSDIDLSPIGVAQSRTLGAALASLGPDRLPQEAWCSPYARARRSLELGLDAAGLSLPTRVDERLRDRELGILDGLTMRGTDARFPEEAARRRSMGKFYHRPPGGESWADVALRVRSVLGDLDRVDHTRRLLIMCHDAVVMAFRYVCEGLTETETVRIAHEDPVLNLSVTQLHREHRSGPWRLIRYNDVTHLSRADVEVTRHLGLPHDPAR
jgi:broad specificity phosphatase PhoE